MAHPFANILVQPFSQKSGISTLHFALREKTKKSFLALIKEIHRALNIHYDYALQIITNLDTQKRFLPQFYFDYFSLLESMQQQNAEQVQRIMEKLNHLDSDHYYSMGFIIDNKADNEVTRFLQKRAFKLEVKNLYQNISPTELIKTQQWVTDVFKVIQQAHPDLYDEMKEILSVLHIYKGKEAPLASTSLRFFGMITLGYRELATDEETLLYFFDSIIHELSHIYLNLLMTFDPFVLNSKEEFYSAARNTPRPMKGIFHAHFVFFRLIIMYRLAEKFLPKYKHEEYPEEYAKLSVGTLPVKFYPRLHTYIDRMKLGEEVIKQHAKLTPIGQTFFNHLTLEKENG